MLSRTTDFGAGGPQYSRLGRNRHAAPTRGIGCNAALLAARKYIVEGIARYEYERAKSETKVCLYLGDLDNAMYHTKVALFIGRIQRVSQ